MEVHAAVLRALGAELGVRHGLSVNEFDVLVNIPRHGIRHRDLTCRVILTQSALSRLLDRLEVRGLIRRRSAGDDGRGVEVELTAAGGRLQRQAMRTNADVVDREFAGKLDPAVLSALGMAFERLLHPDRPGE